MPFPSNSSPRGHENSSDMGGIALLSGYSESETLRFTNLSSGLPADILNLFCAGTFSFWRWKPRTNELRVDGSFQASSLEDWMTRIHPRDQEGFSAFLDKEWSSVDSPQVINYRFKPDAHGDYEMIRHTAVMHQDERQPTLSGLIERLPSEDESLTHLQHLQQRLNHLEVRASEVGNAMSNIQGQEDVQLLVERLRTSIEAEAVVLVKLSTEFHFTETSAASFQPDVFTPQLEERLPESVEDYLNNNVAHSGKGPITFSISSGEFLTGSVFGHIIPDENDEPAAFLFAFFRDGTSLESRSIASSFVSIIGAALCLELKRHSATLKLHAAENQIRQAQKLADLGKMVSGVAHDFNNLLTVIQGHTSLIEESLESESQGFDPRESLDLIKQASTQAVDLAKQLLLISRQHKANIESCDLNVVIHNFVKMMRRVVEENFEFNLSLFSDDLPIMADKSMIGQVLMNLIVNARDAMTGGGTVTIETTKVKSSKEGEDEADYACLAIEDTGCGMDEEQLKKIFDPFYTTKEEGKGTGLGLANVSAIIDQHGGYLNVTSTVGVGTRFEVFLPIVLASEAKAAQPSNPEAQKDNLRGSTILLVEDESAVRKLVKRLLEMLGVRVLEAPSGRKALDLWPEIRDEVSLVISDIVMPDGISGWELAKELHKEHPKLGILLTSGYDERPEDHDLGDQPQIAFLQKPYETKNLRQMLGQLLEAGTES